MKKKISILSGGLDSTILTYKLVKDFGKENVIALTFCYGQKHDIEVEKAKLTCQKLGIDHRIIDISFIGDIIAPVSALSSKGDISVPDLEEVLGDPQPKTYVPYRNLLFTSMAFTFAESNNADQVYSGFQAVDLYGYWDTSEYFVENLNKVSELNRTSSVTLVAPFINMTKSEEIKIGAEFGVPFEDCWSCYNPQVITKEYTEGGGKYFSKVACGKCATCKERIQNFIKAGVKDGADYSIEIPWGELIKENEIVRS